MASFHAIAPQYPAEPGSTARVSTIMLHAMIHSKKIVPTTSRAAGLPP